LENPLRLAFYISGTFIVSSTFTLFTTELLPKIAEPTWVGTAFLIVYGLVYMNIVFVSTRRYMRRLEGASPVPYILGLATALAPVFWVFLYDAGFTLAIQIMFAAVMTIASFIGAFFGHRAGLKAQVKFQQALHEYLKQSGQLPDELKRPHDNLNKN
jgi:hypothetical protein